METESVSGALVVDRRWIGWADRLRAYRVLVDGQEVGRISNGEQKTFPLSTGRHEVQLRIDWTGSGPVEVDIAPESVVTVCVQWRGNLFTRNGYLHLRPAVG